MKTRHLSLKILHRFFKCLRWSPLMVTQDSHSPVCPIVGQDLGWNVVLPLRKTEYYEFSVCRIIHGSRHTQMKSP